MSPGGSSGLLHKVIKKEVRCVHANLVVFVDCFGTGCLGTTKMVQFFPIFYIELRDSMEPTQARFHPTWFIQIFLFRIVH